MAYENARAFLARVVPFDGIHYVSIHHKYQSPTMAKPSLPGQSYLDLKGAVRCVEYYDKVENSDVWVCLSSLKERTEKQGPKGKFYTSLRKAHNAVAYRSLWIDIDVKPGAFETLLDAKQGLKAMLIKRKLPFPSIGVGSGRGLQVHWTCTEDMSVEVHDVMALTLANMTREDFGPNADAGCTTDKVRLFRVPDTRNMKDGGPYPVELLWMKEFDYTLEKLQGSFGTWDGVVTPKSKAAPGINSDITGGINAPLVYQASKIEQVATVCPWIKHTLDTGGADNDNALWFHSIRIATMCENPNDTAHRLSSGYAAYTREETEENYDRAVREKQDNPKLGPPKCAKIGAPQCATCPMLKYGRDPLNIPGAMAALPLSTPGSDPLPLPPGYGQFADGTIFEEVMGEESQTSTIVPVFNYPIIDPWIDHPTTRNSHHWFNFVTIEAGKYVEKRIPGSDLADKQSSQRAFTKALMPMELSARGQTFLTSFMKMLRDAKGSIIRADPLGWHSEKEGVATESGVDGFAYNGVLYTPTGERKACRLNDTVVHDYRPTGSRDVWDDLTEVVTKVNRPDINMLLLSGFAAPLAKFTGQDGLVMGGYSIESGIGKTTVMKLTQAIWSQPKSTLGGLTDTPKSMGERAGMIKNLPLGWDEIKGQAQADSMVNLIFSIATGKGMDRLNRAAQLVKGAQFQTLLTYASNSSLADALAIALKTTTAGQMRVFEFPVKKIAVDEATVARVGSLADKLNDNYGHAGLVWAEYLGRNHLEVYHMVKKFQENLTAQCSATQDERFWIGTMAAILTAGLYANKLKLTNLDLKSLKVWMREELYRMRNHKMTASNDFAQQENIMGALGQFLSAYAHNYTIKTDTVPMTRGRPPVGSIKLLTDAAIADRLIEVSVQIAVEDKLLRIQDNALQAWCEKQKIPKHAMIAGMVQKLGATQIKVRLGSGTRKSLSAPVVCWEIAYGGTELEQHVEV